MCCTCSEASNASAKIEEKRIAKEQRMKRRRLQPWKTKDAGVKEDSDDF
jgi:hypothetical protein